MWNWQSPGLDKIVTGFPTRSLAWPLIHSLCGLALRDMKLAIFLGALSLWLALAPRLNPNLLAWKDPSCGLSRAFGFFPRSPSGFRTPALRKIWAEAMRQFLLCAWKCSLCLALAPRLNLELLALKALGFRETVASQAFQALSLPGV